MQSTPHMQQLAKQTRYHKIILICKTIAGVNNNDNQTGKLTLPWHCNPPRCVDVDVPVAPHN